MLDTPQSLTNLLDAIERLLVQNESDWALHTCHLGVRFGRDAGHPALRIVPTVDQARSTCEIDGNQCVSPKAHLSRHFRRASDGAITERLGTPPPPPDPELFGRERRN